MISSSWETIQCPDNFFPIKLSDHPLLINQIWANSEEVTFQLWLNWYGMTHIPYGETPIYIPISIYIYIYTLWWDPSIYIYLTMRPLNIPYGEAPLKGEYIQDLVTSESNELWWAGAWTKQECILAKHTIVVGILQIHKWSHSIWRQQKLNNYATWHMNIAAHITTINGYPRVAMIIDRSHDYRQVPLYCTSNKWSPLYNSHLALSMIIDRSHWLLNRWGSIV